MTITANNTSRELKEWIYNGKEIKAVATSSGINFTITLNGFIKSIAIENIVGIPANLYSDPNKLIAFLSNTYIKLAELDDGNCKVYIQQRISGGANIINPITEPSRLWPKGVVPYEIDSNKYTVGEDERKMILAAIEEWNEADTGFRFVPRTSEKDYVIFGEDENVCHSNVGRIGGPQYVRCDLDGSAGFNTGSIMHEIGHVIGFYHEHQRNDRDKHITVQPKGRKNDYAKMGTPYGEYDIESIMHYPFNRFLKPKRGLANAENAGNRRELSHGDIAAAKYLYKQSLNHQAPTKNTININTSYSFHKTPEWKALITKGDKCYQNEKYYKAYEFYKALITEYSDYLSDQDEAKYFYMRAKCAYNVGRFEYAKKLCEEAIELDPDNKLYIKALTDTEEKIAQNGRCLII